MDDLDNLLAGLNALDDFLPERFGFDPFDEIPHDLEVYVRVQQRETYLAQGIAHILFGNLAKPAQVPKCILEFAADGIEHSCKISLNRALQSAICLCTSTRRRAGPHQVRGPR